MLPVAVVRAAHRYGSSGTVYGVLVVRGLLPAFARLEPTPATVTPPSLGRDGRAAEMLLLAVMTLLGEPFTFASLYDGRLVQHVTAVPGREFAQTSEGSQARLDWHVEDAFTDSRCDYFGLLCLRGAPDAATMLAPARMLRLPAPAEKVLRQPRFVIAPDIAHGAGPAAVVPLASVLSGPPAVAAPAWLSEDEFSPLTEVVVGVADGARLPALDRSAWLNLYPGLAAGELASVPAGPFPRG